MTFLARLEGQAIAIGLALLAAWGWLYAHDTSIKSTALETERARVEMKADENVQKADAARRTVDDLPPDRLRKFDKYCRDCR